MLRVRQTYYLYVDARAQAEALTVQLDEVRTNLDAANARHDAGVATIADVLQARTLVAQTELALATTRGTVASLKGALAVAVGLPPDTPYEAAMPEDELDLAQAEADATLLMETALARRPDLLAARSRVEAARSRVKAVESEGRPRLGLDLGVADAWLPGERMAQETHRAALTLRVPLWSGRTHAHDAARARAEVDEARLRLADATLRAPIDGRTGQLLVHAGNLVKADDAQPLVVIRQIRPIDVAFSVPESSLPEIRLRTSEGALRVEVAPRGDDARAAPVEGELTFVDNAVDRASGTILLKASFPNDDGRLWPGAFVDVMLRLRTLEDVVVVPSHAVQAGQQGAFAFVVGDDATAQMRPLRVGPTTGGMTVVESGIAPGERVIVDGQSQLGPGAKVEVKDVADAPVTSEAAR